MSEQNKTIKGQKAWIVFSGQADLFWLKCLKPGFRHCSVLLNDGVHWITLDPLSNYTDVVVHNVPLEFDLPLWLGDRGHILVEAHIDHPSKPAPWMLFSCVEAVKRVLGVHSRFLVTPWQLYCYLKKQDGQIEKSKTLRQDSVYSCLSSSNQKGDLAWEV